MAIFSEIAKNVHLLEVLVLKLVILPLICLFLMLAIDHYWVFFFLLINTALSDYVMENINLTEKYIFILVY